MKNYKIGAVSLLAGLGLASGISSASVLSPGDVAVVEVEGSGDGFSFVALKNIPGGTILSWTDEGWLAAGGFSGNGVGEQGFNAITVPGGGISAGTVTSITIASGLGASGESIHLFEGTAPTANPGTGLIWGINWGKNPAAWDADGATSSTSALASVLSTAGTNTAPAAGAGWVYTGPGTGTQSQLIANIANAANWSTTSSNDYTGGTSFTVQTPEPIASGAFMVAGFTFFLRRRNAR